MSYSLAMKRSELLICTTTHVNPKSILLSDRLHKEDTSCESICIKFYKKSSSEDGGDGVDRHRGTGLMVTFNTLIWVWVT